MSSNIAAIVLNYNDYVETMKCVDNMISLRVDASIIIVDNNSSNDSFQRLSDQYINVSDVYVIPSGENRGYSAGNNVGFKYAFENLTGIEFVMIMNPDTLFDDPDLLNKLANKLLLHEDAAVIAPVMVQHGVWDIKHTYWDTLTTWDIFRRQFVLCKKRNQSKLVLNEDKTAYVGAVSGSFLMLKRKALEDIGFLDEGTFLYGEENLLSKDLEQAGYRELLDVTATFFHNHKKSAGRIPLSKKLWSAKITSNSRIYVVSKHYNHNLVPVLKVIYYINIAIITVKHVLGSLKSS